MKVVTYTWLLHGMVLMGLAVIVHCAYVSENNTNMHTVVDIETGDTLRIKSINGAHTFNPGDTAWRDDVILYPSLAASPDSAMGVVVVR
jgi:hypothetical protein